MEFLEKLKQKGIMPGLDRMRELTGLLGNPQNKAKNIIHIAGTNGKGSVGTLLEAALLETGCSVGRYSSPAVFDYFEIFRKNGKNITKSEYDRLMEEIKAAAEKMSDLPTAFEAETALAFLYTSDCDYCIIETGMGGREDATNVIDAAKIAVITSVSIDHTKFLGNTVSEIAAEKCGIFNNKTTVICAENSAEVKEIVKEKAQRLYFADRAENIRTENLRTVFDCGGMRDIELGLLGLYQTENAAAVVKALRILGIEEKHIRSGLKNAVWRGRFDIIRRNPVIIADGAHNKDAFLRLLQSLREYFPNKKYTFITGVLADKDYTAAAEIFSPYANRVYTVTPNNPRALSAEKYAAEYKKFGAYAECAEFSGIPEIIEKNEITVAFGSLSFMERFYKEVSEWIG